ncbi:ATP-grasp peptide maturase system methyltransferase [Kribbella solani]|uniref:ATP-grasp peptide maturase system methyltransferase n=1 Tax=Kribbella solani TaxID=236067 RepID=UPI0029A0DAB1|nr:ATP-grasp peptide maturase system methyltransferase [Kribbella solani]MDX3003589.1 ATP-grasp peptide maturase system methyltransferase [Kribbella solani]
MSTEDLVSRSVELRRRLAATLAATGDVRTQPWRRAVEAVPREAFLAAFFRPIEGSVETLWEPVTADLVDGSERLELIYRDETWVTQLDRTVTPEQSPPAVAGVPTSSSTMPGLVVRMLEELRVEDGSNVLEIGTGTGYSTALLSERLGGGLVTSVEYDPDVAARAAAALRAGGYAPTLVVGDGLGGYPTGAPYDRVIATCSVHHLPAAWIEQVRPGGTILTTLTGWLDASAGLVRVEATGAGRAIGRFLGTTDSFMPARPHDRPPLPDDVFDWISESPVDERPTAIGPEVLDQTVDWTAAYVAQLAIPDAQPIGISEGDGPMISYLIDVRGRAFAALIPQADLSWRVRTAGSFDLWARVETALANWRAAGEPSVESFELRITPDAQKVCFPGSEQLLLPGPEAVDRGGPDREGRGGCR